MSIEKIIRSRRTVHSYLKEEVPEEVLAQALKLATFAPNHRLTFPFQFVRVGKVTRKKLADLAVELKIKKDPEFSDVKQQATHTKFLEEGSLTFFVQNIAEDEFTRKEDYATMACAIQNFSLFLWQEGYGSKWSSGAIIRSPKAYGILGVDPEKHEIVGLVWAGKYSTHPPEAKRPKLESLVKRLD